VGSGGSDVTANTYDITSQQQQSDEDDVCIVCQTAFEGVAPGVKYFFSCLVVIIIIIK
jgi:hypothetical protein